MQPILAIVLSLIIGSGIGIFLMCLLQINHIRKYEVKDKKNEKDSKEITRIFTQHINDACANTAFYGIDIGNRYAYRDRVHSYE